MNSKTMKWQNRKIKKKTLGIVPLVVIFCSMFSCNQSKSLQELLQEESKAIDRFITSNDLVILRNYPSDGVFKANEYFKTVDGLFFNVVDSGNGNRVQLLNDVSIRFDYSLYLKDIAQGDSTVFVPPSENLPYSFVYGISQTYSSSYYYSSYGYYSPLCQAWIIPLSYVGEGAIVNMIIPSSIGSYMDNMNVSPVFYKNLRYTRFN